MKERKDCKIVQDLLPNYIEHLTSEETNKYIEEHLATCEECKKILKNMQKEMKTDGEKIDGREVDYIKKYNKKLIISKVIEIIVLIVLLIYVGIVINRLIILNDIGKKQEKLGKMNNFYIEINDLYGYDSSKVQVFYKDEKALMEAQRYGQNNVKGKTIIYQDKDEEIYMVDDAWNGKKAYISNNANLPNLVTFVPQKRSFLDDLEYALYHKIDKIQTNGRKCYILNDNKEQYIIDVETGLVIRNVREDYRFITSSAINQVTDKDVEKPDLTGYEVIDNRNK